MNSPWPLVRLDMVLNYRKEFITIDDLEVYKRCRVQLHAKGIALRDTIVGLEIKTKRQQVCRTGDFLVAEIDAKLGGFGIVPGELDGAIVSSHYFLFDIDEELLDREFLGYFLCTPDFMNQVSAQGSTNYAAIRPQHVLEYTILLPPIDEQRRIVARIEELAARIEEARGLRQQAVREAETLLALIVSDIFDYQPFEPLPRNWVWNSLEQLLVSKTEGIITGPFGTLLAKSDIVDEGIPVLGIQNIKANEFVRGFRDHINYLKAEQLSSYRLVPNDIVIARSGTVGRSCIVPFALEESPIMSTNLMRLRLNTDKFIPELLSRLFNKSHLVERHKLAECRGSTRSFFTQKILLKLQIPTPPIHQQEVILTELRKLQRMVDKLRRLQAETSTELDALLPSILDKAFKGDI